MPNRRQINRLLASAGLAAAGGVRAQGAYPSRPITWVVPFTPGGITDTTSRVLTRKMGEVLGQTFVVENRPGAGGSLGTEMVARAAPDGYTVLYATSGTMGANLALFKNLKYDPQRDFVPVHGMFLSPLVLVVEANKPWKTVGELLKDARANPGKLNYGSAGPGTATHLACELLQEVTGTKLVHVPYKGSAPALQDLLGGQVDILYDYVSIMQGQIKSGRVRALAVLSDKRIEALPDVPTIAEAGVPKAELSAWSGLVVPAGTPQAVVDRLASAMEAALADKATVGQFVVAGSVPMDMRGPAFGRFMAEEQKKWAELVRRSGATLN